METGTLESYNIKLTNEGGSTASDIYSIQVDDHHELVFSESTDSENGECSTQLDPGDSCELTVDFLAEEVGEIKDRIKIKYFNGQRESSLTITTSANSILNIKSQKLFNLLAPHKIESRYLKTEMLRSSHRPISIKIDDLNNDSDRDLLTISSAGRIWTKDAKSYEKIYEVFPTSKVS